MVVSLGEVKVSPLDLLVGSLASRAKPGREVCLREAVSQTVASGKC